MSRDIKFRAWNLVAIPKRMMSHKDICFYKDLKMYELFCDTLDNRPWIIMQYTGLKDKNGKETLVPVIPSVVVKLDVENKKVYLRPLKGLFSDECAIREDGE